MAKITPYKFVNPGVIGNSSVPVVRATSKNLLATNRIGLTVEGIANSLARNYMLYGNTDLINTEIDIYRSITREDIRAVARKYLNAKQRVELNYIPKQN